MPTINVDPRAAYFANGVSFNPTGKLVYHRPTLVANPTKWDKAKDSPLWSARIFVGLEKQHPTTGRVLNKYPMPRLVNIVKRVRMTQVGDPGSSFITQRGLFKTPGGKIVPEKSAQVIILSIYGEKQKQFKENIGKLAETIRQEFDQDMVIVEIQRDGIRKETGYVMGE